MGDNKRNQQYWINREVSRIVDNEKTYDGVRRTVKGIYQRNNEYILRELKKLYKRGLSNPDYLRGLEPPTELGEFLKLVKKKGLYEMLPDNFKFRANRLTTLNRNIWLKVKEGAVNEYRLTSEAYRHGASRVYHNLTHELARRGADGTFGIIPMSRLERIMAIRPNGQDFSHAIWRNSEKLIDELTTTIASGFQLGKTYEQMATELTQRMNVEQYCSDRIIKTEANYYANQAELESYKEMGVEKYQYIAVLDDHTSETCEELHGKIFSLKDAKVGVNYPPMHPNCRSSTISVLPWEQEGFTGKWTARRTRGGERYEWEGYQPRKTPKVERDPISPVATLTPTSSLAFSKSYMTNISPSIRREYTEALSQDFAEYPQVQSIIAQITSTGSAWGDGVEAGAEYVGGVGTYLKIKRNHGRLNNSTVQMIGGDNLRINFTKVKAKAGIFRKALKADALAGELAVGTAHGVAHHEFGHALGHYLEARGGGVTHKALQRLKQLSDGDIRAISHQTAQNLYDKMARFTQTRTSTKVQRDIVENALAVADDTLKIYTNGEVRAISNYGSKSWLESFAELFAFSQTNPDHAVSKAFKQSIARKIAP